MLMKAADEANTLAHQLVGELGGVHEEPPVDQVQIALGVPLVEQALGDVTPQVPGTGMFMRVVVESEEVLLATVHGGRYQNGVNQDVLEVILAEGTGDKHAVFGVGGDDLVTNDLWSILSIGVNDAEHRNKEGREAAVPLVDTPARLHRELGEHVANSVQPIGHDHHVKGQVNEVRVDCFINFENNVFITDIFNLKFNFEIFVKVNLMEVSV